MVAEPSGDLAGERRGGVDSGVGGLEAERGGGARPERTVPAGVGRGDGAAGLGHGGAPAVGDVLVAAVRPDDPPTADRRTAAVDDGHGADEPATPFALD